MYCTTGLRKYAFCYFRCFKQPGRGPVMLTVPLSSEVYCQLYTHTIILVAMGGCPQTCMIKQRAASRVLRSHSAPHIRIPIFLAHSALKIPLCSCVGARKCPQDRICEHIRLCGRLLAVYYILVATGECPQTCMNKPRAAPLLRALASLHTFAPRPAAGAFHAFALLCAHVWALANVRKTGYASISVFAAACSLFITYLWPRASARKHV